MRLLLVRHGETVENQKGITQGHLPGNLSKKGIAQSNLLAKRLSDIKIDFIISSDLRRAVDTAKIIAKKHPKIRVIKDKRLRERNFGIYNGEPRKFVYEEIWKGEGFSYKPPKGESLKDVVRRVKVFYKELLKKYSKNTVLIVAHGGTLLFLTRIVLKENVEGSVKKENLQRNSAITEFEIEKGKVKTLCLNCDKHL